MNEHSHSQVVPRGAILGAALLILTTVTLAASARSAHLAKAASAAPAPLPIEAMDVRFEDRPDGTLAVLDAATGREVSALGPGTNNFVRGVLRGMFRARKLESMGHDARFRLAREADGRLTLEDPEVGRHVDLDSFGPTNSASFGDLLAAGRRAR